MLYQITLLLIGSYYLKHGLFPLLTGKPCFKASLIRLLIICLLVFELFAILLALFIAFVALYGATYAGVTVGNWPFYILFLAFNSLFLWLFYRKDNDVNSLKHSISLVGISPEHAFSAVTDTLTDMQLDAEQTLSGFKIIDRDIAVKIALTGKQICFSISRPLDIIFVNQFCKKYQRVYKRQHYPIPTGFCYLSCAIGMTVMAILTVIVSNYSLLFDNIVYQSLLFGH